MGPIPPPFPPSSSLPKSGRSAQDDGKGAGRVMAVVIFPGKATFVSGGISFSPLGETGEGFSCFALQSRHASQKPFDAAQGRHHPRSNCHQRKTPARPTPLSFGHLPIFKVRKWGERGAR